MSFYRMRSTLLELLGATVYLTMLPVIFFLRWVHIDIDDDDERTL